VRFSLLLLACVLHQPAWAADAPTPPLDAALKKVQAGTHLPSEADAAMAAGKARDKLSAFDPRRVAVPSFPRIPEQADVQGEIGAIIKRRSGQLAPVRSAPPDLLVFVSFSMPRGSLRRLARQAERARAAIVLRGLAADAQGRPSFHATGMVVGSLGLERDQGFSVNPVAFRRFGINQVPAFVLLTEDDCQACGEDFIPKHLKLSGDVSLDYALHAMESRRPGLASRIRPYLERLKTGFFAGGHQGGGRN
jgi:conjugal transfer pilus assembly protein TrbC